MQIYGPSQIHTAQPISAPHTSRIVETQTASTAAAQPSDQLDISSAGQLLDAIRDLPREFRGDLPNGIRRAEVFCAGCLVVEGSPYTEDLNQATRLAADKAFAGWPLIVLHDDAKAARSAPDFLWSTWTRFEPAADIYAAATKVVRHHLAFSVYFQPGVGNDRTFLRETFHVGGFAFKITERNEKREVGVPMSGRLEHRVELTLHVFPDTVAPWANHHAAPDIRRFGHFGSTNDLLIPFRKILVAARRDGGFSWGGGLIGHAKSGEITPGEMK
jgi:hypothetical protein